MTRPRPSMYRSGQQVMDTSVPSSNPAQDRLGRLHHSGARAGHVHVHPIHGAQIRTASCTGRRPRPALGSQACRRARSISAPFAWQGKLRSERGLGVSPTCTCQPNTVCKRTAQHGVSTRVGPVPEPSVGLAVGPQRGRCATIGGWPMRCARVSASMPYWTPRTHFLNSSRWGPCGALVASPGRRRPAWRRRDRDHRDR